MLCLTKAELNDIVSRGQFGNGKATYKYGVSLSGQTEEKKMKENKKKDEEENDDDSEAESKNEEAKDEAGKIENDPKARRKQKNREKKKRLKKKKKAAMAELRNTISIIDSGHTDKTKASNDPFSNGKTENKQQGIL